MKCTLILAIAMLSVTGQAAAQAPWVTGRGDATCGEALASIERESRTQVVYTEHLQGFINALNWRGGKRVSHSVPGNTLGQMWIARCRVPSNTNRRFVEIADEIYLQLESARK